MHNRYDARIELDVAMHFKLPEPLHGWREFAHEVIIIVLGVTLALGAEQMMRSWNTRAEVASTRAIIASELADSGQHAIERVALEGCLRDRIGHLTRALNVSDGIWSADPMPMGPARALTKRTPSMPPAYRAPNRLWTQDAWDTAKAVGMLGNFGSGDLAQYASAYRTIAELKSLQEREIEAESKLSFLSFDQRLDNASRINALSTLSQLDVVNSTMALLSRQLVDSLSGMHLEFDRKSVGNELGATFVAQRNLRGRCVHPMKLTI